MIHEIRSIGTYYGTLAALQDTGVELLQVIAASTQADQAKPLVKSLNRLHAGYGDWLARKPVAIVGHVKRLLKLRRRGAMAYRQAVRAVVHDINWPDSEVAQATFDFHWSTVSPALQKAIKGLFHSLFDTILEDKNFRKKRFGPNESPHGKHAQVQAFKGEHPGLNTVCPACDLSTTNQDDDPNLHEDLDHYLPKQNYPPLAVAPMLLVPVCDTCNRKGKRDNDPLIGGGPGALMKVFLPFLRPARDELSLVLVRDSKVEYPVLQGLTSKQRTPLANERVRRLDETFSLFKRWKGHLQNIDREFQKHMRRFKEPNGWTDAGVTLGIKQLLTESQADVGLQDKAVLFRCYLEWVATRPTAEVVSHMRT